MISERVIIWILDMNQRVISSVVDQGDRSAVMLFTEMRENQSANMLYVEKQGFMFTCN